MNFLTVSISSKFWNMKSFDERWSFLYPWTWVYLLNHRCKFCEDWYLLLPSQIFTISTIEKLKQLNFICCCFIVTTNVLYGKIVGPEKKKLVTFQNQQNHLPDIGLGSKSTPLSILVWFGRDESQEIISTLKTFGYLYICMMYCNPSVFIIFCLLTLMCYQLPPSTQQSNWALTKVVPIGTRQQWMGPDMLCQSRY